MASHLRLTVEERVKKGARAATTGALVNLALATAKILGGILGNSYALIADGIESCLDLFSSAMVWFGLSFAAKPPDDEHPYGHGKAETLASLAVALTLIITAIFLAARSVREIITPHHAPAPFTLLILTGVIFVKEVLFRRILKLSLEIGSTAIHSDAWHHRADTFTSLAAFIGISIAIIGGPGFEPADDYAALLACILITYNGIDLLRNAVADMMDTAPDPAVHDAVAQTAQSVQNVIAIETCRIRKMGFHFYADLHVVVDPDLTVRQGHSIAHAVKDAVRASFPSIADVLVHIEPAAPDFHPGNHSP
jgi:cation diffusion facilitator family transporter